MDIIRKLHLADYISFTSLFFAWVSILLLISDNPRIAIVINMLAFSLDLLDGYVARKNNTESNLGRQIDSFVDVFTYLLFSAILFYKYISINVMVGVIGSFFILLVGGLRLIRFNNEGILSEKSKKYYKGLTVVHVNVIIICIYLFNQMVNFPGKIMGTGIVIAITPLMISKIKSYKLKKSFYYLIIVVVIAILVMLTEYGYKK